MAALATLDSDGWALDCGEEAHAQAPKKFEIPPRTEREQLLPGQLVKLMFRIALRDADGHESTQVERMWVEVTGRIGNLYRGELDNDPSCTGEIQAGLEVYFEARHVIQIWRE